MGLGSVWLGLRTASGIQRTPPCRRPDARAGWRNAQRKPESTAPPRSGRRHLYLALLAMYTPLSSAGRESGLRTPGQTPAPCHPRRILGLQACRVPTHLAWVGSLTPLVGGICTCDHQWNRMPAGPGFRHDGSAQVPRLASRWPELPSPPVPGNAWPALPDGGSRFPLALGAARATVEGYLLLAQEIQMMGCSICVDGNTPSKCPVL